MNTIKMNQISEVIKEQIKNYNKKIIKVEQGKVAAISDGVAVIFGLDNIVNGELVKFKNNVFGMAMNLEEDSVGVVVFGDTKDIIQGDFVERTKEVVKVPVGDCLLGRVINSLGQSIDGLGQIEYHKTSPIEKIAPGVMYRVSVSKPLETGIMSIDSLIPIGKGQRELIIGDRQTGKTAIAIDAIINQKGKNVKCVYVAIGQKESTVAQITEKLREAGALEYTVIVSSSASDSAPSQYIAPYTGVTIAEEWMSNGQDVLIVYDDLSKHAIAYRTLSLLLRRPPGREAYPGDVFYLHSRLLERAARVNKEIGGGSITALPIIETLANDISAYIPTNVISITDGQIFLSDRLFNSGIRPAVDTGFSVSRVGSSAQIKAIKQVSSTLKLDLAQYYELKAFSKFGSDLDETTKATLAHGERIVEILKQKQYQPLNQIDQCLVLLAVKEKLIKFLPLNEITNFKNEIIKHFNNNEKARMLRISLEAKQEFNENLTKEICNELKQILKNIISKVKNYSLEDLGISQEDYNTL